MPPSTKTGIPRLIIAGTSSGVGKTTFTVGLVRALRLRGLRIAVFKCGPDYLDPTYHARAAGTASHNLDGWMMGRDAVIETFTHVSRNADIAVIEGVMGLYDGASATTDEGSTAEIAKWLEAPVLLVLDASGMARTVGALGCGFAGFDPNLRLAGLICNRVGSRSHLELLREAAPLPPVLGALPKAGVASFPERHLGLRTASEDVVPEERFSAWATMVREWCDLDSIIKIARETGEIGTGATIETRIQNPRCTIGVAYDDAFHFYYEDNLRQLERAGAKLVWFSPVRDPHLPPVDGLYIGGGYPEVYAAQLAANQSMRSEIGAFARGGGVIYAECGGLMYLSSSLRTLDGTSWPMCDVLPGQTAMCDRLQALGYVEIETTGRSIIGDVGTHFRGHQFRYSNIELEMQMVKRVYRLTRRRGGVAMAEGFAINRVVGSYVHAHWGSNPRIPETLVRACVSHSDQDTKIK
jgi:cobyrinic acid a,c-diamide synthase